MHFIHKLIIARKNQQKNQSVRLLLEAVARLSKKYLSVRVSVAEDVTSPVGDASNLLTAKTAGVLPGVQSTVQDVGEASESVKDRSGSVVLAARAERREVEDASQELKTAADSMAEIAKLAQDCNAAAQRAINTAHVAYDQREVSFFILAYGSVSDSGLAFGVGIPAPFGT